MISKAVFLNSLLVRFSSLGSILQLGSLAVGAPALFASMIISTVGTDPEIAERGVELMAPLFGGPLLPMVISYMFIQDNVGNARSLNNGEYMALLLTRPLSRFSYIFTKWLAGAFGVIVVVSMQAFVFETALRIGGVPAAILDPYAALSLVLNSFSYAALVVCIYSFPQKIGLAVFLTLVYASLLGSNISSSFASDESTGWPAMLATVIGWIFQFVHNCLLPSIDVYALFMSLNFTWTPLLTFLSNITIYLLVATFVINRREFFYATE